MRAAVTLSARCSRDVSGPGRPQSSACEPTAARLQVALADGGATVAPVGPPTPVCEHHGLQLTAFRAV